jgi:hypothetical protein
MKYFIKRQFYSLTNGESIKISLDRAWYHIRWIILKGGGAMAGARTGMDLSVPGRGNSS